MNIHFSDGSVKECPIIWHGNHLDGQLSIVETGRLDNVFAFHLVQIPDGERTLRCVMTATALVSDGKITQEDIDFMIKQFDVFYLEELVKYKNSLQEKQDGNTRIQ